MGSLLIIADHPMGPRPRCNWKCLVLRVLHGCGTRCRKRDVEARPVVKNTLGIEAHGPHGVWSNGTNMSILEPPFLSVGCVFFFALSLSRVQIYVYSMLYVIWFMCLEACIVHMYRYIKACISINPTIWNGWNLTHLWKYWGCLFVGFAILENSQGSKRTSGKPNVRTYSRLL